MSVKEQTLQRYQISYLSTYGCTYSTTVAKASTDKDHLFSVIYYQIYESANEKV